MRSTTTRESLSANLVVFAGMPRTGSTSLFHILGQHPQIFRPFRKEMGYFLFNYHKGERWYLSAYSGAAKSQRCIDITPEYFFDVRAMERINAFGNDVRVVVGVRDPVSFVVSLHREYGKRYSVPPLDKFIERYAYRRGSASIAFELRSGIIRRMLSQYCATFGERLLLYDFATFAADPLFVLQCIERFAGVGSFFTFQTFTNLVMNRGDRTTHRWLSALLSAEPLIDSVSRILPPAMLQRLAAAVYSGSGSSSTDRPVSTVAQQEVADSRFEEDRRLIDELFQGRAVVDGRGQTLYPFE